MEKVVILCMIILSLHLNDVTSSPLWLLMNEHEPNVPDPVNFTNIFESRLDETNRYRHLQDLMKNATIAIDKYEERILHEIIQLDEELPFLREIRTDSLRDQDGYLQPRTLVKSIAANNNHKPHFIPLRKRKRGLSVDLTLQTLRDMLATEEERKGKESDVGYSASRLLRAGKK